LDKLFSFVIKPPKHTAQNQEKDIHSLLSAAEEEQVIEKDEAQLSKNALMFDEKSVGAVMVKNIHTID
jgi:CBS domain containing-hemolysin-like protein